MKIALLGHGAWGKHHADALRENSAFELAAVATRDWQAALATPGLEGVDIVLPTDMHFEVAAEALRRGLHVLLEKPMAATSEQCEQLIELAQDSGRTLLVGHEFRLSTQWGRIRRLVDEGAVGEVQAVTIDLWRRPYREGSEQWRLDPARVGSWVLEEPVHFFDLACWWMKESGAPQWVYARGSRLPGTPDGLWNNLSAVLEFETGAHATLTQSLSVMEHHLSAKVLGSRGALMATWDAELDRSTDPRATLKLFDGERIGEIAIEASGEWFELRAEVAHFAAVCRGDEDPIITPTEAARAVSICEAAERSIRSGEAERITVV